MDRNPQNRLGNWFVVELSVFRLRNHPLRLLYIEGSFIWKELVKSMICNKV